MALKSSVPVSSKLKLREWAKEFSTNMAELAPSRLHFNPDPKGVLDEQTVSNFFAKRAKLGSSWGLMQSRKRRKGCIRRARPSLRSLIWKDA